MKKLLARYHVDKDTECLYRYVKSRTETFIPHTHDYCEIFLTLKGDVIHVVNGQKQILAEGSLIFIRDTDYHFYEYDKKNDFDFVNVSFTKETVNALFNYLGEGFPSKRLLCAKLPPVVTLSKNEKNKLFSQLDELNAVDFNDKLSLKLKMRAILFGVFTKYFAGFKENEDDIPHWLEAFHEKLSRSQYFTQPTTALFALTEKSREHTSRLFKKHYNITLSEYVNDLRINYAANLLINSNLTVTEICYECGFSNLAWFYELFTSKHKASPKKFRETYKLKRSNQA